MANILWGLLFVGINKYVVQHKIDYVYGVDDSQTAFVSRYWDRDSAYVPLFTT